jgi:16S rRNA (cytosine967-C5)-methyltransferase
MLAAQALDVKRGMQVLDCCAAPGGKSAYMCEKMQLTGRVFAWELHEKRAQLLDGVKRRLKLDNLRPTARDASQYREDLETSLDAVLLDAPCSGTGVMAEKPDIKHRLKAEDIPAIVETQKKLLDTVCRYVKPGGTLVYSTCSILPEENHQQVEDFLARHPEYQLVALPSAMPAEIREKQGENGLQLLPHRDQVEGFFIAKMRRAR